MTDSRGFSSGLGRYTFGPGRLLVEVGEEIAGTMLDRPVSLRFGELRSDFVLRSLRFGPSPFGLAAGRLDRLDVGLEDVRWEHGVVDQLDLALHQVRLAPGLRPAVVAGPVDVFARLGQRAVDEWLGLAGVAFGIRLGADGFLHVSVPGRRAWAHAGMTAEVHGRELRLRTDHVMVGSRPIPAPGRLVPPLIVPVPRLPRDLQLREVWVTDEQLVVRGVIGEMRERISLVQLQEIQRVLLRFAREASTELVLPRLGPR